MENKPPHIVAVPIFFLMLFSFSYVFNQIDAIGKWYSFPVFVSVIFIHIVIGVILYLPFQNK